MTHVQVPPRNLRINLDHDTRFMYKHCNKTLFSYYKHTDHAIFYMLVVLFSVNLNTLHSAATLLQISYSEATWRDLWLCNGNIPGVLILHKSMNHYICMYILQYVYILQYAES